MWFPSWSGQVPIKAAFAQAMLLGISTTIGLAVKDIFDTGSKANGIYFAVISASHFAILSVVALLFGYGGGMLSSYPAKPVDDRWLWFIHGQDAFTVNSQGVETRKLIDEPIF